MSYLWMLLNITNEGTIIDMMFYAKQLLEGVQVKEMSSLGIRKTFEVDEESLKLLEEEKRYFHLTVAKLLCMSKRARPDSLTVVSFSCTRVQEATQQDMQKLTRVLGYVKRRTEHSIKAYVDAAFALHSDSKLHTGVMVYVGKMMVYVSSKKKRCMSKSPTDAELVGLTDNLGFMELLQEFMEFLIIQKQEVLKICQDCSAVETLVMKGGGITRTKHLCARMNLEKEVVDQKRALILYARAETMKADGFSKPYDLAEYRIFADMIQGNGE